MKKFVNKVLGAFKKKPVQQPKVEEKQVNTNAPLYQYRMNKD